VARLGSEQFAKIQGDIQASRRNSSVSRPPVEVASLTRVSKSRPLQATWTDFSLLRHASLSSPFTSLKSNTW
jgi:hypothetical protein